MLTACDKDVFDINTDPFKDEIYNTTLSSPISTFLTEQEGFGEYVKLLNYSNMFNALNQSSSGISFTAFVPTDAAMHEFYHRRGIDSLQQLSPSYARQFVLYHTVKDSILQKIRAKGGDLIGKEESLGTTPRQLTDLLGSLCDLTSGSGDKGTPVILIQGYFDNLANS